MSYGVTTVKVRAGVVIDKRANSRFWQARISAKGAGRIRKSTKTHDKAVAEERALEMYFALKARVEQKLPAQTRKFKHVAEFTIQSMQNELDAGGGKQAYKDYISALRRWLIPFFGATDVANIDLAKLSEFAAWRDDQHGKPFSQSGVNNHNAALNRVLDEAELRGWITKSMRPTLLNKATKGESRGSFTDEEYRNGLPPSSGPV